MSGWVYDAAARMVSGIGYPKPMVHLLNRAPVNVSIRLAEGASIARGARVSGQVRIDDGATVEDGAELHGDISVGAHATVQTNARVHTDATIGEHVRVGEESYLQTGKVEVGAHSNLVRDNEIYGNTKIGRYCAIAPHTIFQAENHPMDRASTHLSMYDHYFGEPLAHQEDPIRIGNDVWIGTHVIVLPGVTIGDGAVVGAGSVVTRDVKPYSVVAGAPADHKAWRFDLETREQLQEITWWEWSDDRIADNQALFMADLTKVEDLSGLIK